MFLSHMHRKRQKYIFINCKKKIQKNVDIIRNCGIARKKNRIWKKHISPANEFLLHPVEAIEKLKNKVKK